MIKSDVERCEQIPPLITYFHHLASHITLRAERSSTQYVVWSVGVGTYSMLYIEVRYTGAARLE